MSVLVSVLPAVIFVMWLAPLFPFLYVIVRWRSAGRAEPGLGSYSLVLFFMTGAVLVAAAALTGLLFFYWIKDADDDAVRALWGLLMAASIFFFLQIMVGRALAPSQDVTAASRTFGGFVMALSGFVVFAAVIVLCVMFLMDTDGWSERRLEKHVEMMKGACSALGVFGIVYGGTVRGMR